MPIAFDFETCLIRPGLQAPPIVCVSTASATHADLTPTSGVRGKMAFLLSAGGTLIGHNVAYDATCLLEWEASLEDPLLQAYEDDRILDTMILERIAEIGRWTSRKMLSLDVCAAAYGLHLTKDQEVRLSYGSVYGAPLEEYTEAQRTYAIEDAVATYKLFERQRERYGDKVSMKDLAMLTRKALWLQVTRNRGLRTDPTRLKQLRRECTHFVEELISFGQWAGLIRKDGTRNMKAIKEMVTEAYGGSPPLTEKLGVSTARATLEESGDPVLELFAEFGEWNTIKGNEETSKGLLPALERGMIEPIHTKWGIADSTRTTSSKPNVQNLRRKAGIRECFIPRPGFCFIAADHSGLELVTLAQTIVTNLGLRHMADQINAGADLHCGVAAVRMGISYEDAIFLKKAGDKELKNNRQLGKVVNFGRPGGMGAKTLVLYGKQSYGVFMSLAEAEELIAFWEQANPDGRAYLEWISSLPEAAGMREMTIPMTAIRRRGCTYSAAANTHFQALGAVVEAVTGWEVMRATFSSQGPLSRCRLVNFVHDEFILECPIGAQTEALAALLEIMRTAPRRLLPDVKIDAEGVAMARWSKDADAKYTPSGELIIWDG